MKGIGKASSAITILNSFASKKGAAIGVDLWTEAEVKIVDDEKIKAEINVRGKKLNDSRIVKGVLKALHEFTGMKFGMEAKIYSQIPVGKGLKSSSAAANALTMAALNALHIEILPEDFLKLSVQAARYSGVTITGAMDDACASYMGGLCVTDNSKDKILFHEEVEEESVVILVPKRSVLTEELKNLDFSPLIPFVDEILRMIYEGKWKKALMFNGLIYSNYLGYSTEPILSALKMKAFAGLCGKGPAFFAITNEPEKIKDEWQKWGETIITGLR